MRWNLCRSHGRALYLARNQLGALRGSGWWKDGCLNRTPPVAALLKPRTEAQGLGHHGGQGDNRSSGILAGYVVRWEKWPSHTSDANHLWRQPHGPMHDSLILKQQPSHLHKLVLVGNQLPLLGQAVRLSHPCKGEEATVITFVFFF